jgi:hypothetical protein
MAGEFQEATRLSDFIKAKASRSTQYPSSCGTLRMTLKH